MMLIASAIEGDVASPLPHYGIRWGTWSAFQGTFTVQTIVPNAPARLMTRWRATNPGTRSATRFTRNWNVDTNTGTPTGRHVPISFKTVSGFDVALMAAISRPWRDIVMDRPSVVASGMAPPDRINP
jgi:hypothetical protein